MEGAKADSSLPPGIAGGCRTVCVEEEMLEIGAGVGDWSFLLGMDGRVQSGLPPKSWMLSPCSTRESSS